MKFFFTRQLPSITFMKKIHHQKSKRANIKQTYEIIDISFSKKIDFNCFLIYAIKIVLIRIFRMEASSKLSLLYFLFLFIMPLSSIASDNTLSISTDNDGLMGTDQEYSSGLFIRFSKRKDQLGYGVELSSQIWTPSDIEKPTPQPNERPYAGLVYLQLHLQNQTHQYANKLAFMLGKVGPDGYAGKSQKIIHDLIGSPEPKGWAYQISNKMVYQLSLENNTLFHRDQYGEWSGSVRGQLGNFQPEVGVGLTYRIGIDLDTTFGATGTTKGNNIDPNMLYNSKKGFFFYLMTEATYRFKDITIEGNKPIENVPLDITHSHFTLSSGVTWYRPTWGITFSLNGKSATYEQAHYKYHTYANIGYFYRF